MRETRPLTLPATRFALAAFVGLFVTSCAAKINPDVTVTYVDPSGVSTEAVAILPVTAGEGLEGFRRMAADSLLAAFSSVRPDVDFLPADETLDRLNDAGLADEYSDLIQTYQITGIVDQDVLQEMASTLGVDHLLHLKIQYSEGSQTSFSLLSGANTTRHQDVELFTHLWSAEEGDVVWEASGGASVKAGEFQTTRSIPEILGVACRDLASHLPVR